VVNVLNPYAEYSDANAAPSGRAVGK
jgi:hypothetical protein